MGPPNDILGEIAQSTAPVLAIPFLTEEDRLNSLQTIRARSEALHNDIESDQSAGPNYQTALGTIPGQRPPKRSVSEVDQEQGPATPDAKIRTQKPGRAESLPPSSAQASQTTEPRIAAKVTTSKRGKRNSAQADRTGTAHRSPDRASPDSLDLLDSLQPSDIGGSLGPDSVLPDIFAGLNEADTGIEGLTDDLSDIDGGGLPTAVPKTPQKSRR
jgi:hypothetical protein